MKKKELSFEERLLRLQQIVSTLENGTSPLEESVTMYKEGMLLAEACKKQLEQAKHDIQICTETGTAPFTVSADEAEE